MEMNTLWKIRDCENLLKSRVNEKFVLDAVANLELKLRNDYETQYSGKFLDLTAVWI